MNKNIVPSRMSLLLVGAMALVSSCQDYEPFNDQVVQDKAYTHEFVKQFGDIDPNQDWDLFGQLARHIGPATRATMDEGPTITQESRTIDITLDQHGNYTLILPELNIGNNSYANSNLGTVTQDFLTTARTISLCPVQWTTTADDKIGIYWYVDEDGPGVKTIMGKDDHLYYIKEYTILENHKSRLEMVYEYNDGHIVSKYIGDDFNNISSDVSPLAYIIDGNQSLHNQEGPQKYRDDVTANFLTQAQMDARGIVKQYLRTHPVKVTIPASITEYGFWIQNMGAPLTNYAYHYEKDIKYSEWKLNNAEPIEDGGTYHMSYTATFCPNDLKDRFEGQGTVVDDGNYYLCFEDWAPGQWGDWGDADLNDLVYIAEGLDDANIKDNNVVTERALLVCEDLSSYDFDFNDIVLGLTYKEVDSRKFTWVGETTVDGIRIAPHWEISSNEPLSEQLIVTPMAAGGAFETTVKIGDYPTTVFGGEIHTLLKEQNWNGNAKRHEIINAGTTFDDNRGVKPDTVGLPMSYVWDVGNAEGQYATHLSQLFAEGFITLECYDGQAKKLVSNNQYAEGSAPQMMLLPEYFEWPQEEVYISNAYTGFSDWVADVTKTNWILDTQVAEYVNDRGDLMPVDPQQQDNPVIIEGIQLPVQPGVFVYHEGQDDEWRFYHAYHVSLVGVDQLATEDAKANLIVHYNPKTSGGYYIDDNDGNLLISDPQGDNQAHNTTYTFSANKFNMAITSTGIWIMNTDDNEFGVSMVELEIVGATNPTNRHALAVTPPSLIIDEIGSSKQITAESSTGASISYQTTDRNIATVDMNGNVTAVAEGSCQIVVTAVASGGYSANVARINVTVDKTPTYVATLGERTPADDIVNGSDTYYNVKHQNATITEDMSTWNNGAEISFYFKVASYANYEPQIFRILNSAGEVIAGNLESVVVWEGSKTFQISKAQLQSCLVEGEYVFTFEFCDPPTEFIADVKATKIAN